MSASEFNNTDQFNFNTDRAANELSRRKGKIVSDLLAATQAKRKTLVAQLDQILVDFGELAHLHGHVSTSEDISRPFEFPAHRKFYDAYRQTELVCYLVSLLLLAAQTWLTLSFDWTVKVAIVVAGFLVVWKLFPALLLTAFDLDQRREESVKPVKITFVIAAVPALGGLFAFAITRSIDETTGTWVVVYNNALVAAELGFAICGACAHVMKKFYEWSIVSTRYYTNLEQELETASTKISELRGMQLFTQSTGGSSEEDHHEIH
ncbi:MAG TPA: hypothetical protein VJ784_21805 [Pyrinomonadaceae bacterium]|nr:hypothetical protein [Pyrinomonadaceae bacterium]